MSDQRIAIALLAVAGISSAFMPWVKVTSGEYILGTDDVGWICLGFFVVPLVLAFLGDRSRLLKGGSLYVAIAAALLAAGLGIWRILALDPGIGTVEYGLYLLVISGLVIPLAAYIIGDRTTSMFDHRASRTSYDTEIFKSGPPD
ncbi:MAG: hypothetical protein WBL27_03910 [Salinimicrobium sp.]